jgi:hypothetical protein
MIRDNAVVEKVAHCSSLDGKVYILRDVPRDLRKLNGIELFSDHTYDITAHVQQRPATVAGFDLSTDLQETRIVQDATERVHYAGRDRKIGREQTVEWKANRNDSIASMYRCCADVCSLLESTGGLKKGQIIGFIL